MSENACTTPLLFQWWVIPLHMFSKEVCNRNVCLVSPALVTDTWEDMGFHSISFFIILSWLFPEFMLTKVFLFLILAKPKEKIIHNWKETVPVIFFQLPSKVKHVSLTVSPVSHVTDSTDMQREPHKSPESWHKDKIHRFKKSFTLEKKHNKKMDEER